MHARVQQAGAVVLVGWCLVSGAASLRAAFGGGDDERARLEREFHALAPLLPPRGTIGYVHPPGADDSTTIHAAQYALVPRVLTSATGTEFVIVPRGAVSSGGDSTLAHYAPVGRPVGGHRVYRRTP